MAKAAETLEASSTEPAPTVETVTSSEPAPTAEVRTDAAPAEARDEKGRFAPKGEQPQGKAGAASKAANGAAPKPTPEAPGKAAGADTLPAPAAEPAKPAAPTVKAPQSWTPAAREAFAKAPPEVQAEVAKREREVSRALQETAQARQYVTQVNQSLAPYAPIARANGMDVMTWAGNGLQMMASLYAGTPAQKAATIARAISLSGADLEAINAHLAGQPPPQGQPAAPPVDVNALVEQKFQTIAQQYEAKQADSTLAAFMAEEPEFIGDVWQDMQLLLQSAATQGRNMTLKQAYDRACKLDERVQSVMEQRKAAEASRTATAATQRAKAAAVSPKSSPAGGPPAQTKGIDAAMRAAADKLGM
ncbi:MAG TPA: hypothetical protein VFT43_05325 [Candidatus Polarisedimenticolia bacterium]|nr:hypothetical protein [Candidatus Polarisedimenticolia bacterium]